MYAKVFITYTLPATVFRTGVFHWPAIHFNGDWPIPPALSSFLFVLLLHHACVQYSVLDCSADHTIQQKNSNECQIFSQHLGILIMNPPKLWFTHKQTSFSNSCDHLFSPVFRIRHVHSFLKTRNYRNTVSQNYKGWLLFQQLLQPYTIMTSQFVLCLSLHFLQQPADELITARYCLWSHTYRYNSFISPISAFKAYTSKHSKYCLTFWALQQ